MRKQLIDQTAHFSVAFLIVFLTAHGFLNGAIIGLALGLVREFTEWQLEPNKGKTPFAGPGSMLSNGSLLDYSFWTLGGAVAGLL